MTLLAIAVFVNVGAMVSNILLGRYWTLPINGITALWCSLALFKRMHDEVKR